MKFIFYLFTFFLSISSNVAFGEEHLTLEQLPNAIKKYNSNNKEEVSPYAFHRRHYISRDREYPHINSLDSYRVFHSYIEGALSFETYQTLYDITEEEFVKQVFGNMEHLTPEQISKAMERAFTPDMLGYLMREIKDPPILKGYIEMFNFISLVANTLTLFDFKTYHILYGISEEEFVRQVFGKISYLLTLEQLPKAIEEYNKRAENKFTSPSNMFHLHTRHDNFTISPEGYQTLYGISEKEFVKQVFGKVEHFTPEQLPAIIDQLNRSYFITGKKIISLKFYKRNHLHLYGFFAPETYQTLYDITEEEFVKQVFGKMEHLTPEQLPKAIEEIRLSPHDKKVRFPHVFDTTLSTLVSPHNSTSLENYSKYHYYIKGALAFETYQALYGISEKEFIELLSRSTKTEQSTVSVSSRKTPVKTSKIEILTLEQLPNSIEKHNKKRRRFITSFERYQKYHHLIPGALSFEEYQTSHEITEEAFVRNNLWKHETFSSKSTL